MSWLPKRRGSLYAVTLRTAAKHAVDERLIARQIEAAKLHPVNGIKPLLIEDQPDTWVDTSGPIDFEELPV